jgi:hypothetical protein
MNQGQPFYVDLPITLGVNVLHEHRKSNGHKVADPLFQSYGRSFGKRIMLQCIHESTLVRFVLKYRK